MSRDPRGRRGGLTPVDVILLMIALVALWSLVQGKPLLGIFE